MRSLFAIPLIGVAAFLATSLFVQRLIDRMIFQPSPGAEFAPAALGIDAEEIQLESGDGVRLHAYYLPAPGGATRAILFLHGNAGNASHRLPNAAMLQGLGAHVLLPDYRGYGLSSGTPSEVGVYSDARAGLAHLIEARAIPETRVIVFGRSLGGAIAVDLAQDRDLAGVILESTFTSLPEMARRVAGPLGSLFVRGGFDSIAKIGRVRSPLLFFHGNRDTVVPYELGVRLHAAAPEPKAFETIDGADHGDTIFVGGRAYLESIGRFLDRVAPN
ncbi:MAG: alpha/beta hydrolase [Myxococcales bacterium]|nr:alpha/beta hydrolase [Myxococcales bacterium]MDH5306367.1 alpha/beta hydrolase [Myxococcales bacterium]MDH5565381.1 alpha/beta hydrolase [Myxococcales bacterium]